MGGRLSARFADNFSFIHGLFLKCGAAIQEKEENLQLHHGKNPQYGCGRAELQEK